MTCRDCLHYGICRLDVCFSYADNGEIYQYQDSQKVDEDCEAFSDKSEWLHLIGKDCKTAYYALGHGSSARVMAEPIYGVAIKNGKCYIVDECDDLYEIGKTVFLTKEKAKKEVERRKNR